MNSKILKKGKYFWSFLLILTISLFALTSLYSLAEETPAETPENTQIPENTEPATPATETQTTEEVTPSGDTENLPLDEDAQQTAGEETPELNNTSDTAETTENNTDTPEEETTTENGTEENVEEETETPEETETSSSEEETTEEGEESTFDGEIIPEEIEKNNTTIEDILYAPMDEEKLSTENISIDELLEEGMEAPIIPIIFDPEENNQEPLTEREFEKEITLDKDAPQACKAVEFNLDISNEPESIAEFALGGKRNSANEEELEIGGLPDGVDMVFLRNDDYTYSPDIEESSILFKIINQEGSQKGSFNVSLIYKAGMKTTICQINLINF